MRTLVIGLPLPHVSFDNYSFLSAPAFSDYRRLIVDTAAVSRAVQHVISEAGEHLTYSGQPIKNGPSAADAFSLQDLLAMRQREGEWFLARGGVIACMTHPDVAHPGVAPPCGWRRYSWLPAPAGFRYEEHLFPGFGTPGAELTDEDHPFAPYVSELSDRIAYRATVDEKAPHFNEYGTVFARSHGGAAIGVELRVAAGSVVLLPPLLDPASNRGAIAQTMHACLEACERTS